MPNRMALFLVKDVANLKIKICPGTPIPEQIRNYIGKSDTVTSQVKLYHFPGENTSTGHFYALLP